MNIQKSQLTVHADYTKFRWAFHQPLMETLLITHMVKYLTDLIGVLIDTV